MGSEKQYKPEKLVVGVLISRSEFLEELQRDLKEKWGEFDLVRGPYPFDYTNYYDDEMDTPIERWFFSFEKLRDPSGLAVIKLASNELEEKYRREGRRKVNLDPGLLALSRFILATTKDNAHRIPLHSGIYGETTLLFRRKDFEVLEWTYPDYQSRTNRDVLIEIRNIYKKQLRALATPPGGQKTRFPRSKGYE